MYQYYIESETISNCTYQQQRATGFGRECGQGGVYAMKQHYYNRFNNWK
ncbi:hypothetical protein [Methanobacterium formicicum]|uniref:Uncharacterized protein n=1 Tax=Methanobacterium formicicum TaxID=2162 RepID=A0A843AUP8_METFO|nr:hypothetical protein [Methanobacterium formicicum]MBF4475253.1 hypothetical protein [Methanobacterium formicicum]